MKKTTGNFDQPKSLNVNVFDGKLELLLVVSDKSDHWMAVSPNWGTLLSYPLQGYLLLEGRQKEGYVLFPEQSER